MLKGDLRELDAEGNTKEGGVEVEGATVMPQYLKDDDQKKLFEGAKAGDIITFNPYKAYAGGAEVATLLKVEREKKNDYQGDFSYQMSILKSADRSGSACCRYTFDYPALPGLGHFIHTYVTDGNPIPTFQGEPERVAIPDSIDVFTDTVWNNLDENNRISLYVRYTDLATGEIAERLINKNK